MCFSYLWLKAHLQLKYKFYGMDSSSFMTPYTHIKKAILNTYELIEPQGRPCTLCIKYLAYHNNHVALLHWNFCIYLVRIVQYLFSTTQLLHWINNQQNISLSTATAWNWYLAKERVSSLSGPNFGLTLVLNLDQMEYMQEGQSPQVCQ